MLLRCRYHCHCDSRRHNPRRHDNTHRMCTCTCGRLAGCLWRQAAPLSIAPPPPALAPAPLSRHDHDSSRHDSHRHDTRGHDWYPYPHPQDDAERAAVEVLISSARASTEKTFAKFTTSTSSTKAEKLQYYQKLTKTALKMEPSIAHPAVLEQAVREGVPKDEPAPKPAAGTSLKESRFGEGRQVPNPTEYIHIHNHNHTLPYSRDAHDAHT